MHVVYQADARDLARIIPDNSIDLIIADPPYNLSRKTPTSTTLFNYTTLNESWDFFTVEDYRIFTTQWLSEAMRVLRPGGSLFITLSYHSILQAGQAPLDLGFNVVNYITWEKSSAAPSITRRQLTPASEIILWLSKGGKYTFNYDIAKKYNHNKQLRDVWRMSPPGGLQKAAGKYPAQKPLALIERIIDIASNKEDTVLDLFSGSGTTTVAASNTGRKSIAVELSDDGINHIKRRMILEKISYELFCDKVAPAEGIGRETQEDKQETALYKPTAPLQTSTI